MAVLIFRLRHVPEDEAEEVRNLLSNNAIEFYETSAGNWQTAMPGIWLKDDAQLSLARQLLDDYQQQRLGKARDDYQTLKQNGQLPGVFDRFRENPLRFVLYCCGIGIVLYISLHFFIGL